MRIEAMSHGFGIIIYLTNFYSLIIENAVDIAVVGSVDKVKEIGKNYGIFNQRLQKMYPPSSFTIRTKDELP